MWFIKSACWSFATGALLWLLFTATPAFGQPELFPVGPASPIMVQPPPIVVPQPPLIYPQPPVYYQPYVYPRYYWTPLRDLFFGRYRYRYYQVSPPLPAPSQP